MFSFFAVPAIITHEGHAAGCSSRGALDYLSTVRRCTQACSATPAIRVADTAALAVDAAAAGQLDRTAAALHHAAAVLPRLQASYMGARRRLLEASVAMRLDDTNGGLRAARHAACGALLAALEADAPPPARLGSS